MTSTTQWVLASRPEGTPTSDNFRLETAELPELSDGQILVDNTFASVDPYMRGRMNDVESYIPPFQIDEPLTGTAIGTVAESRSEKFKVGDTVRHFAGWRTRTVLGEDEAEHIDTDAAPAEAYLGILGVTGLTAYAGLTAVGEMKEGDVVFISGAAGAVGSAAGQIAKQLGAAKVIGSAGSAEKIDYVKGLGFDEAFNYKDGDVTGQLAKAAPEGIDVYFDNVGGDHLEAAIDNANTFARIAMCGAIAQYNDTEPTPGPSNLGLSIGKCLTLRGFVVGKYSHLAGEFQEKIAPLVLDGSITYETTVREGIDNMPDAFLELFEGSNTGKMIVSLQEGK